MKHFAKVVNGIVKNVIVADQDVIDSGLFGDPDLWIETSYNTKGNVYVGEDDGVALRGNYAIIGGIYDAVNDVFYQKSPYPSWILNQSTWLWEAPVAYPGDGELYYWDEPTLSWKPTEQGGV